MANNLLKPINHTFNINPQAYSPSYSTGIFPKPPTFTTGPIPSPSNLTLIHPLVFKMNDTLTLTPSDVVIIDFGHGIIRVKRNTGFSIIIKSEHEEKRLEAVRRMEAMQLEEKRRKEEYDRYVALQKRYVSDMTTKQEEKYIAWKEEQDYYERHRDKLNMLSEDLTKMLTKQVIYSDFIKVAGDGTFFKQFKENEAEKKTATEVQHMLIEQQKRMRAKK